MSSLPLSNFSHLFALSAEELHAAGAMRMVAQTKPGFPCRVSLQDAEPGEEVILVHYEHQSADTPFRSSHAIYIRVGAQEAELIPDQIPEMLRSRLLSLRAFDEQGMMVKAEVAEGKAVEETIE